MQEHDHDPLIARIARDLRAPVSLDPALDARVMAQVLGLPLHRPAGAWRRLWRWWRRPRVFAMSPLGALAAAATLAVTAFVAARALAPGREPQVPETAAVRTPVEFLLVAPHASSVALVGDFNDWHAATPLHPVTSREKGVWSVTVPLAPGRYRYAFVVDGVRWEPDPSAPPAPDDEFGTPASVVTVGG